MFKGLKIKITSFFFSILLFVTEVRGEIVTLSELDEKEVDCLALNMYHEARDQGNAGLIAVAHVTLTRVKSWRFKDTYCSVIKDGYVPGRLDCHFSWYCDGKSDKPKEKGTYQTIRYLARWFILNNEYVIDPTGGATHYHKRTIVPWWVASMEYRGAVKDHLFYFENMRYN